MGQISFQQQLKEIPLKARNYAILASLVARIGPLKFARLYKEYPWIPMAAISMMWWIKSCWRWGAHPISKG